VQALKKRIMPRGGALWARAADARHEAGAKPSQKASEFIWAGQKQILRCKLTQNTPPLDLRNFEWGGSQETRDWKENPLVPIPNAGPKSILDDDLGKKGPSTYKTHLEKPKCGLLGGCVKIDGLFLLPHGLHTK